MSTLKDEGEDCSTESEQHGREMSVARGSHDCHSWRRGGAGNSWVIPGRAGSFCAPASCRCGSGSLLVLGCGSRAVVRVGIRAVIGIVVFDESKVGTGDTCLVGKMDSNASITEECSYSGHSRGKPIRECGIKGIGTNSTIFSCEVSHLARLR